MPGKRKSTPTGINETDDEATAPPYVEVGEEQSVMEERLMSTLLLAGERLADTQRSKPNLRLDTRHAVPVGEDALPLMDDPNSLHDFVRMTQMWAESEPRRKEFLHQLRVAFTDGDMLRVLFRNLFPDAKPVVHIGRDGKWQLKPRQVEVLRELAAGLSQKEIAERLFIVEKTVENHIQAIYNQLELTGAERRPIRAVTRAMAMGYLDLDAFDYIAGASQANLRDFGIFNTLVGYMKNMGSLSQAERESLQCIAECGLLLLIMSGAMHGRLLDSIAKQQDCSGRIAEIGSNGQVVRLFGTERLRFVRDIAIAPLLAARQGFTPGNLFVANSLFLRQGMNENEIVEFTPDGDFVRAFCGGPDIRTKLGSNLSLCFAPDGRLLAGSSSAPDAVVAFKEGGGKVQRFALCCPNHITASENRVYVTHYSGWGCNIRVFDTKGREIQTIGGTSSGVAYAGIAVSSRGLICVVRDDDKVSVIDIFDTDGALLKSLPVPGYIHGTIAMKARNCIIACCRESGDVLSLSLDGRVENRIHLSDYLLPRYVAVDARGHLFVGGQVSASSHPFV
jgi:DNA-binding CsgD family transcriptional regulator